MYLFFDVETNGLPFNRNAPASDVDNWPRLVQIAWLLCEEINQPIAEASFIIKPNGKFIIPLNARRVHHISTERAEAEGVPCREALEAFMAVVPKARYLVAHNMAFDFSVVGAEFHRIRGAVPRSLHSKSQICTMLASADHCQLPGNYRNNYKWPLLEELYMKLFKTRLKHAHDALKDVHACAKCFFELKDLRVV